jgi:Fe-Mn family superoxide dismutase
LEPRIDTLTMELHHDRHYVGYVNNLNAALKDWPQYHDWTLERLLTHGGALPSQIRVAVARNAGGVYNHELYFMGLAGGVPGYGPLVPGDVMGRYKDELKKTALGVFGSGYGWLCRVGKGCAADDYVVLATANQDTPLVLGLEPLVCVDVWEHAYYLKHYNKRDDYFEDWWSVVTSM